MWKRQQTKAGGFLRGQKFKGGSRFFARDEGKEWRRRDRQIKLKELWSYLIKWIKKYMLGKGEKEGLEQRQGGGVRKRLNTMSRQLSVLLCVTNICFAVINQSDRVKIWTRRQLSWRPQEKCVECRNRESQLTILNQKCGAAGTTRGEISWSPK